MNVVDGFVKWNPGYDQHPNLHVVIEGEVPPREEFIFQPEQDKSFWWAEKDGFYRYFAGHPDRPGNGYAGDKFTLNTSQGEMVLEGPYSGRGGVVNAFGYGPCVDVRVHQNGKRGTRGISNVAVALEYVEEAAEFAGVELFRWESSTTENEYTYRVKDMHPPEWVWDGEQKESKKMPYGNGEFTHPDGSRITVERIEWVEERRRGFGKTKEMSLSAWLSVLYDSEGTAIDEAFTPRPDVGYHYLMAVHTDTEPPGKAEQAPSYTEKYRSKAEKAGTPVPSKL